MIQFDAGLMEILQTSTRQTVLEYAFKIQHMENIEPFYIADNYCYRKCPRFPQDF